jgi:hypothetical protein
MGVSMSDTAKFCNTTRTLVLLPTIGLALGAMFSATAVAQHAQPSTSTQTFKGVIDLDVRTISAEKSA